MSSTFWVTLACIVMLPVPLLLGGFLYQRAGGLLDRRRLLAPGRLVEIEDGRRLYLREKGHGGPSVVFESGFAASSLNWVDIQSAVGDRIRAVSYDRCGLGWSSAARTGRTPGEIAAELRLMLRAAGVEPPYVLVGHSFGGLVMRRYAVDYPEETLGVVLVDPMRTDEWPPENETRRATVEKARWLTRCAVPFAEFGLARLAVTSLLCGSGRISGCFIRLAGDPGRHLATRLTGEIGKLPPEIRSSVAAHWSSPDFYQGLIAHLEALPATVVEMSGIGPIRSVPVDVLTPGSAVPLSPSDLRKIGVDSRQIIAEQSGHWVHLDEPGLVIDTILEMASKSDPTLLELEAVL